MSDPFKPPFRNHPTTPEGDAISAGSLAWITSNPGDLANDRVNVICPDADVIILADVETDIARIIVAEHNASLTPQPADLRGEVDRLRKLVSDSEAERYKVCGEINRQLDASLIAQGEAVARAEKAEAERDAIAVGSIEAAAQYLIHAGMAGDAPDDPLATCIRALAPSGARAALDRIVAERARLAALTAQPGLIAVSPADAARANQINPQAVSEAMENSAGFWATCCGCHESNEGYPTGPYSSALQCTVGAGCHECGGLGAVWDTTDYAVMAEEIVSLTAQPVAQEPLGLDAAWQDLLDKDDRTSPEDQPDMALITRAELADYMRATPAPVEAGPTVAQVQAAWTAERDRLTAENNRLEMQCFAQGKLISGLQIENAALRAQSAPVVDKPVTVGVDLASGPDQTAVTLVNPTQAALDVLAERQRQISAEGWTPEHDDQHRRGELAMAAVCYALNGFAGPIGPGSEDFTAFWPWADEWWKPKGHYRDLTKAGALILAEMERLNRAAPVGGEGGGK